MSANSESILLNLLPCPFCGSKDLRIYEEDYDSYSKMDYYVFCVPCGADAGLRETKQKAVEAWNKRTEVVVGVHDVEEYYEDIE